jgi:hypothetical protein
MPDTTATIIDNVYERGTVTTLRRSPLLRR